MQDDGLSTSSNLRSSSRNWMTQLVYMETICGVAQIIRDPSIPKGMEYDCRQSYFSLPSPSGGFSVGDDVARLPRSTNAEAQLFSLYNDTISEN